MANWLYNGVELPELPELTEEQKATYRYAFIGYKSNEGQYCAFMMKTPLGAIEVYGSDKPVSDLHDDVNPDALAFKFSNGEWVELNPNNLHYYVFEIIWANYDVVLTNTNTVVLAASNPIRLDSKLSISVEGAKDGMWLYNGYSLPPLPEYDPTEYPYVTIRRSTSITSLTVILTLRKNWEQSTSEYGSYDLLWEKVGDVKYKITKTGYPAPSIGSLTATDWGEPEVVTSAATHRISGFIWTSKDIVSLGSDDYREGETILAASEPGNVVATFTCSNLNTTDSVYKIAAWCYPKGTSYLNAPHTYTSAANFPGKNHSETWGLTGLTAGTEYELYACIMVDDVATDHNALVTFTADGTVAELDFTNATLSVETGVVQHNSYTFKLAYSGLPYNADGTSAVFDIVAVTDAGDEAIMGWRATSGTGYVSGTFIDLEPLTDYTATFEVYYNGKPTGVTATVSFTSGEGDAVSGYDRDSFLLGFASGLGCTAATKGGAEYNSWAQGYIVGSALRKALAGVSEPDAEVWAEVVNGVLHIHRAYDAAQSGDTLEVT